MPTDQYYYEYGATEIEWLKSRDPTLGNAIDELLTPEPYINTNEKRAAQCQ